MIATVFIALALIVIIGSLITYFFPTMSVDALRNDLNKLVLYIFLPALNFKVVYSAQIGHQFWQLPLLAALGVFVAVAAGLVVYKLIPISPHAKGALILGCAFSNVTYFGIAVLQGLFPNNALQVIQVAVLFEITITPLNLVIGSALASAYSNGAKFSLTRSISDVFKMPLLRVTFVALALNFWQVPVPNFVLNTVAILASTVSGLMIFSLGMALKYPALLRALKRIWVLVPVLLIKLLLSPLVVFFGAKWLAVAAPFFQASVIEAAMPSQLISLVVADRFKLDTELLAILISLDTVLSFITLPLVHSALIHWQ